MSAVPPPSSSTHSCCGFSLLSWKNPQQTAKVFGASIAAILTLKYVNLINLFFRVAFITLFVSGAAEYAGKLVTGTGLATRFKPKKECTCLKDFVSEYSPKLAPQVAKLQHDIEAIVFASDVEKTLKTAGACYALYKITSWFSLYTLLVTSTIAAFTLPVAYVTYEKEIHEAKEKYYSLAKSKAGEYKDLAHEHAKPYIAQAQEHISPYTSKVAGYLPKNRTAGSTVGASPVPAKPAAAAAAPAPAPTATTTGSNLHTTTAMPKVPSAEPISSNIDIDDLRSSIQKDKADAAAAASTIASGL
ncbi:Rtn1 protein [Saccharomycopsis crataegensis]|uniref:Reticulon-like protein n=1 Tax=Saccharomycopsis crataegensis TaxID=43959 RepID=A0AAV5QW22_9ASCO|nr:Rtn1 protein [Saccharomycopsis crataegensis]